MLNGLNKINLANWKTDPNVSVQVAREIERASWIKSQFQPLVGRGSDRAIRTYIVADNQPYRPRLKSQLSGSGVVGNSDFDSNFDNLEILSQTIYPKVVGNALKSEIKSYSAMKHIDFIKEASDSLTEWIQQKRDREIICALSNDFTNAVVAHEIKADDFNGYYGATHLTKNAETDLKTLTAKITAKDTMNVRAIRRAIFQARSGVNFNGAQRFPLKPVRSEMKSENGITIQHVSYIICLDSYQINQLKADPEYQEIQKFAGLRGEKNALFSGIVGMIDNCPILDMGVWTSMNVGLLNSDVSDEEFKNNLNAQNVTTITPPSTYRGNNTPTSIGFLLGGSACLLAGNESVNFYISETEDAGRKTICGVDRVMGISKAKFIASNGEESPYNGTDFSCIGLFSAKV